LGKADNIALVVSQFIMDKIPNNNSQNIVFALITVTGLSVASQSGLAGQLFQVLDQNLVQSASAQNIQLREQRQIVNPTNLRIQKLNVNSIQIEGNQAYQINSRGNRTPLQDGYYRFPSGEILTLEGGRITNRQSTLNEDGGGSWREGNVWERGPDAGPFDEVGWREGNVWERDTSGDEDMQRRLIDRSSTPRVRDTFEQIRPQVPSGNTTPIEPSSPTQPQIQPGGFNRVPPNTTTPNNLGR